MQHQHGTQNPTVYLVCSFEFTLYDFINKRWKNAVKNKHHHHQPANLFVMHLCISMSKKHLCMHKFFPIDRHPYEKKNNPSTFLTKFNDDVVNFHWKLLMLDYNGFLKLPVCIKIPYLVFRIHWKTIAFS